MRENEREAEKFKRRGMIERTSKKETGSKERTRV